MEDSGLGRSITMSNVNIKSENLVVGFQEGRGEDYL